jgi:hypothetical protein
MNIIKLYKGKETEPRYYEFVRHGRIDEKFAGHILVAYPLEKRESNRHCRWYSPDEVRIDWIKEFK